MRHNSWRVMVLAVLLGALPARAGEILVSAAASLTDALKEAAQGFEKEHPDAKVTLNFAASGVLRAQIEQGAPADIFVSADLPEMAALEKAGLVGESKVLAGNELVLAVPAADTATKALDDLKKAEVKHIGVGSPETVPVGRYTVQSLEKLGLWTEIKPKAVYAENVRQVLQYLETGAVEAGFIYRTDALKGKGVRVAAGVPAELHDPIVYPIAVLKRSTQEALARSFMDYLFSPAGQKTLAKFGFKSP